MAHGPQSVFWPLGKHNPAFGLNIGADPRSFKDDGEESHGTEGAFERLVATTVARAHRDSKELKRLKGSKRAFDETLVRKQAEEILARIS